MEMETGRGNDDDDDGIWEKKGGSTGAFTESVGKDGDLSLVVRFQSGLRHRYGVASVVLGLPGSPPRGLPFTLYYRWTTKVLAQLTGTCTHHRPHHAPWVSRPAQARRREVWLPARTSTETEVSEARTYVSCRPLLVAAGILVAPIPVRGMGRVHLENPHGASYILPSVLLCLFLLAF
uniref:Uncharacterized protein n=1 Tax=Bionectria ochroleuca TaxID=29856 RepID=A0A8H7NDV4_BIOOC